MQTPDLLRHIAHLMPQWDTGRVADIEYLPGGYSNANYAFSYDRERYVLRVPSASQPFVDRYHEQAWYAALPAGIGVKPVALDAASGNMLSPWVEGQLLIDAWPQLAADELVTYLRALHGALPANERDYDLPLLTTAYWSGQAPPQMPVAPPRQWQRTCHNDLNPWNVLITARGWVTLDWEFVGNNDPLFDVVALHQGLGLPGEELSDFAIAYLGAAPAGLAERLLNARLSFWIRELGWARYQLQAGSEREEIRAQAELARDALAALDQ